MILIEIFLLTPPVLRPGGLQTKRKRGRPPKNSMPAPQPADQEKKDAAVMERRAKQAKVSASHQAEEDEDQEDQVPDAGAIDDSEGRS